MMAGMDDQAEMRGVGEMNDASRPRFSSVAEVAAANPEDAREHFRRKLGLETDPADVEADLRKGGGDLILVDTRTRVAFEEEHIAGAISMPVRSINAATAEGLDRAALYITYCWGPGCNSSTKGAERLAALGLRVKEMIGGIEYWKREGYATEAGTLPIVQDAGATPAGTRGKESVARMDTGR